MVKTNENQVQFDDENSKSRWDKQKQMKYTVSSIWRTNNKLTG